MMVGGMIGATVGDHDRDYGRGHVRDRGRGHGREHGRDQCNASVLHDVLLRCPTLQHLWITERVRRQRILQQALVLHFMEEERKALHCR